MHKHLNKFDMTKTMHHASPNKFSPNHGSPTDFFTFITLCLKSRRMKESVRLNGNVFIRHKKTETTRSSNIQRF